MPLCTIHSLLLLLVAHVPAFSRALLFGIVPLVTLVSWIDAILRNQKNKIQFHFRIDPVFSYRPRLCACSPLPFGNCRYLDFPIDYTSTRHSRTPLSCIMYCCSLSYCCSEATQEMVYEEMRASAAYVVDGMSSVVDALRGELETNRKVVG